MTCEKCATVGHNILIQSDNEKFICRDCTREEIKLQILNIKAE